MANKRATARVQGVVLRRLFGIQKKNLTDRQVEQSKDETGKLVYDLDEDVGSCGDLIFTYLGNKFSNSDGEDLSKLKTQKLSEEIRKLKIDNDVQEGVLVPASDVAVTYNRAIRSVCDVLDALPSRVKMENPNISAAVLDSINQCLIEVRNKSAGVLDDVNK